MSHNPLVASLSLLLAASAAAQSASKLSQVFDSGQLLFDSVRQRIVVPLASELWEYDGVAWAQTAAVPPEDGTYAYDAVRGRVFLAGQGVHEYDGHSFVTRTGSRPQSPARLVADTGRGVLVGLVSTNTLAVEEWNGVQWSTAASTPAGVFRLPLGMVYDPLRATTVFTTLAIGGVSPIRSETWEWDGTVLAGPTVMAQTSGNATMAFDPGVGTVVSFRQNGVFAWVGGTWIQTSNAPLPGGVNVVASDLRNGRVLGLGATVGHRDAVWQWQAGAWSVACLVPHPDVLAARTAFDGSRDRLFALGHANQASNSPLVAAEWDGSRWDRLTLPAGLARDSSETPVFDAARGETILFGGRFATTGLLGDTWAWNGVNWRLAATTGPAPRTGAALAYDPLRARVLLVGGVGALTAFSDHWEWDGASWTQVSASTPIGGVGGVLGFDSVRNRALHASVLGSAHEYDGATWNFVANTGFVPRANLAWDPSLQLLVGTMEGNGTVGRFGWNGLVWQALPGWSGQLAFDTVRGRMLAMNDRMLVVDTPTPADRANVGAGCGGSLTQTSVTAFGAPRIGNASLHLDVRADASLMPLVLGYGFGATNIQLGQGCALHLQNPILSLVASTDARGFAQLGAAIPNALALRGVSLVAQAGVLDPLAPLGFALSQGLVLTLGD